MTSLGQIELCGTASIAPTGNKILMLAKSLGYSGFFATRLATATSILARRLTKSAAGAHIAVDIDRRRNDYGLRLQYSGSTNTRIDLTEVRALFGGAVGVEHAGLIEIWTALPGPAGRPESAAAIAEAREIVARLTVHEAQAALKAAHDRLEQDVQQRTASLRESELRFRQLTENIREVFWIFDAATGEVLYVSPSYEVVWQRPEKDLYNRWNDWDAAIHPDDRDAVILALESLTEQSEWQVQYRIVRPDNSVRWIRDRRFPIRDEEREIIRIAGIAEDITEQLHLESQLRQSQKMEAIGTLAGGVAHDFNNLMMVILGYADILSQEFDGSHPLREPVDEIMAAGDRARELTGQLLAFSRRQDLQPRVLDPNAIVEGMTKMIRRLIGENIELEVNLGDAVDPIRADPGQCEQVLMNLVVNARDAMADGGRLVLETRNVDVNEQHATEHFGARTGAHVMITVADTGHGMGEAVKARVFEPFFTTKEAGKGTGLGLSTVYGIVEQSGGFISVESEPGLGASFNVYLPAAVSAVDSEVKKSTTASRPTGSQTILLVEDEAAIRRLVTSVLEKAGYTVLVAGDAEEAVRLFKDDPESIDLLLSDVVLPKMDGFELARTLSALSPRLKILHMSGYSRDARLAHDAADVHPTILKKPVSSSALLESVRAVFAG